MTFNNMCSLGPQTVEELKLENWRRLDCLVAHKLKTPNNNHEIRQWFSEQEHDWQLSRKEKLEFRLQNRRIYI